MVLETNLGIWDGRPVEQQSDLCANTQSYMPPKPSRHVSSSDGRIEVVSGVCALCPAPRADVKPGLHTRTRRSAWCLLQCPRFWLRSVFPGVPDLLQFYVQS
eukprot:186645-Amphidinium_carterae.1